DYLHQIAFNEVDTYTSPQKQYKMLTAIIHWFDKANAALDKDVVFSRITSMAVTEQIGRMKYIPEKEIDSRFDKLMALIDDEFAALMGGEVEYA
ncbi:MAG: V-type ATP synthase subunit A, partial [Oscillospiraceae bacterium]